MQAIALPPISLINKSLTLSSEDDGEAFESSATRYHSTYNYLKCVTHIPYRLIYGNRTSCNFLSSGEISSALVALHDIENAFNNIPQAKLLER